MVEWQCSLQRLDSPRRLGARTAAPWPPSLNRPEPGFSSEALSETEEPDPEPEVKEPARLQSFRTLLLQTGSHRNDVDGLDTLLRLHPRTSLS